MKSVPVKSEEAILLRIEDPDLHRFLQRYPLLNGPDSGLRRRALDVCKESIEVRRGGPDVEVIRVDVPDVRWWGNGEDRVVADLVGLGLPTGEARRLWSEFSWKVFFIPKEAKSILSIGCGSGAELFFLQLRAPHAKIEAVDWVDSVSPGFRNLKNVSVAIKPWRALEGVERKYDVVFSNHVIEHSYAPEQLLAQVRSLLAPNGVFVSALPLDGIAATNFMKAEITKLKSSARPACATDAFALNFGHPWKTTFSDLVSSLASARFSKIRLFQRDWAVTRELPLTAVQLDGRVRQVKFWNRLVFQPVHRVVRSVFGRTPPLLITRALEALERRVAFGSNRICADCSMETVFVAQVE